MNQIEKVIEKLYTNNQRQLRYMCDKEISKFGGISQKDLDDFYSRVGLEISLAKKRYDPSMGKTFMDYVSGVIKHSIWKEMTDKNRMKRQVIIEREENDENGNIIKKKEYVPNISIDTPVGDENGLTIGDTLQSDFDMEGYLIGRTEIFTDERAEKYLSCLSEAQRQIVEMKMEGISVSEIKKTLSLTDRQYENHMKVIRSYENTKYLFRDLEHESISKKEDVKIMQTIEATVTTTSEKTKNTSYAISAISKKLKKHQLRDDHVLQRDSGQWNNLYKSELISDILQGKSLTQIIISEEIKDGITKYWLIDGKQRCTNIDDYLNDGFAISKNVQRYNIQYQTNKKDENGEDILTEDGFEIPENKTFDIRKKKFSQLPEELRDKFLEYQIPVMLNLNCTKKEIAYDIARFNRCRPMTVAQNGWTGLEEGFAEFVDNILKMNFFKESSKESSYRITNNKSGMMRRMVVESIMTVNYINDFNKDFRKLCEFLSEEANDSTFIEFYSLVERLSAVSNEGIADAFNIKDSFLWFGLFGRFAKLGIEDSRFADFIAAFKSDLHSTEIDGTTYDSLNEKSTKDKSIVIAKINHLETLMNEYLGIKDGEVNETILDFVRENVDSEIIQEDIEQYEEVLEELTLNVDNSSKLLGKQNQFSLIALVAYSFMNDIDLDDWIIDFFARNTTYIQNQKENYLHMIQDLQKYIQIKTKESA